MSRDRISVWAPEARQVEIVLGEDRRAMERGDDGWWTYDAVADGEVDYAFSLDGGDPLPDPRTAWQPHGVHGPSRRFDPSRHAWRDGSWRGPRGGEGVLGGVVYELHVGTFTPEGTLAAAEGHLDHLVRLGVDVVEVMPVAAFGGTHGWGYDGVAPYAVQDAYGGPAAFQHFVDACHARGLGVCLDVVYNHLGPTGNYLSSFGPYFTDRHTTPWGPALNFDAPGSPQVRRWVIDNALRWFRDFHVDALRLDAVHELRDDSVPHILVQLSDEVSALAGELGRPLDLIAESDLNDPVMVTPTASGGRGMTAQWDDDIHHALHVALTGETAGYYADFAGHTKALPDGGPLAVLAKTLTSVFLHDGRYSSFRKATWGAPVDRASTSGHRFLAYLQTHDQVGNRATGDRIGHTITPGEQAIGAALYLLSPYTAMIFMGEEWRASTPFQFFTSFEEDWLAQAVREGRRGEFAAHGWAEQDVPDPQDPATREASVLRWDEVTQPEHAATLDFYRRLIEIRRTDPEVASGDLRSVAVAFDEDARWLVLTRGAVRVVANLAEHAATVPLDRPVVQVLASWSADAAASGDGVRLDGRDVAVVRTA
ncbi:MAG TPA: malto-oligosyltrehalose trehalohydrolase [Intrasporangium sp.]|uniref:malto-oligosyltrehalose trehalohydrolase n=1 Tax=Intrasporangium sp. TaxID=1925024 RepID=UPI002D76623F|nr:malto-oligosyltrehalose trehalohydrolase [Intrasporangium sp.]HET7398598.1 malto-oligosyltrehalose trehalohydrolase [Intrasporangium sp.]